MKIVEGYTYDDVLLIPQASNIDHRTDVDVSTYLTPKIKLNIPLVSANMDTVTESRMAIAMAKQGGIGIIHRFMTIENQAEKVNRVKRQVGFIINNPYAIGKDTTLAKVWASVKKYGISSFVVVDSKEKLIGLLTYRDYDFESDPKKLVSKMMTPLSKLVVANEKITVEKAKAIFMKNKFEKLPIVDREGKVTGLITAKSLLNFEKSPYSAKDEDGKYLVGAAVGVVNDHIDRAEALIEAGVDVLVVDVAHGHNNVALRALKDLRKKFPDAEIIHGNVATASGVRDSIAAGANAVKVGIGPGGLCTTRMVAGVGVPQFSAVMECAKEAKKKGVTIIADGGTNYPGDITKALAAGASSCMLAGWFAGTKESPGTPIIRKGMKYKVHRGSASFLSTADRKLSLEKSDENTLNTIVPEGVEALVPYKGEVSDVIFQLVGALRSGMSYCNAHTISELQKNARFVKVTEAGHRESKSHNVSEIN